MTRFEKRIHNEIYSQFISQGLEERERDLREMASNAAAVADACRAEMADIARRNQQLLTEREPLVQEVLVAYVR